MGHRRLRRDEGTNMSMSGAAWGSTRHTVSSSRERAPCTHRQGSGPMAEVYVCKDGWMDGRGEGE